MNSFGSRRGARHRDSSIMKCCGWVLAFLLAATIGCDRGPKKGFDDEGFDHVSQGPKVPPLRVTHGVSKVQKSVDFPFEVPAHVFAPRLKGEFSTFIQGTDGARISDESADVELMVMTEEQFDDFSHRRSAESVYAIEPSHDHGVSITLPGTRESAVRYFAVFRRTTDGKTPVWLKADLTAEFGTSD